MRVPRHHHQHETTTHLPPPRVAHPPRRHSSTLLSRPPPQALADYAELIAALPSLVGCAGRVGANGAAGRCDVVLYGGSYGGMLAAWHRLK